ncbi:MAG: rhodanese-like domain-containing protein, partial [Planctomycetota bacterium]
MADRHRLPSWIRVVLPVGLAALAVAYGVTLWLPSRGDLAAIEATIDEEFPDVDQISTATLADLLEHRGDPDGPRLLLIDSREPEEYAVSRIPGAVNLQTANAVIRALDASDPPPARIVIYCSVGYRSSVLARALLRRGIRNVVNLRG